MGWNARTIGTVTVLFSLGLAGAFAQTLHARPQAVAACSAAGVQSVIVSTRVASPANHFLKGASPRIEFEPQKESSAKSPSTRRVVKVIILGPVLGSMDSRNVKTHVICSGKGFVLTATITRSANYNGSALQNILWQPEIEVSVRLRQSQAVCRTVWRMRLTNGTWINRSHPSEFPDYQRYPLTLTKAIH